ncbi:MAG: hypothetical protein GXP62_05425, partial [Oligoflexia bacterium]|nr:hypothetical protein [Oligoflexia bacterium]
MSGSTPHPRRPYAFRGRYLTGIDLAEQVDQHAALRDLRAALAPRLGEAAAQQETESVLALALDELGEGSLAEISADVDSLLRSWARLADAYRGASDRAEMGRVAAELGDIPGRLEERVRLVPNAGGLIHAAIPTSMVARLRYPVAAGRVLDRDLAVLGQRLKAALPVAICRALLREGMLDQLVRQAVGPVLAGLRAASAPATAAPRVPRTEPPAIAVKGQGWTRLDPAVLTARLSAGPIRFRRHWAPRPPPTAKHQPQAIEAVALSASGRLGLWGPWEPWLQPLTGTDEPRRLGDLDGRASWRHCLAVAMSPDGRRAATGGTSITVWELAGGQAIINLAPAYTAELHALAFSPCGRRLAAVRASSMLELFDVGTGQELWHARLDDPALDLAFSSDGRRIFAGGWSGVVTVHDIETGARMAAFDDIGGCINGVATDRSGRVVVTAGGSCCAEGAPLNPDEVALRVWDAQSGAVVRDLLGHRQPVAAVAVLGPLAFSISEDASLR